MRAALREYVLEENPLRRILDALVVILAIVGASLSIVTGTPAIYAAEQGLLLAATGIVITTFGYALFVSELHKRVIAPTRKRSSSSVLTRRVAIGGTVSAIAVVVGLSARQLEAEVLARRLRSISRERPPLGGTALDQITETFERASTVRIILPIQEVRTVKTLVHSTAITDRNLQAQAIAVCTRLATYSTDYVPPEIKRILSQKAENWKRQKHDWSFRPVGSAQTVETRIGLGRLSDKQFQIVGESTAPNYALMQLISAALPNAEYGPTFVVWQHTTAPLDGYRLKQIVFRDCDVIYSGGAVVLNHVYFVNCRFLFGSQDLYKTLAFLKALSIGEWTDFTAG